jgi:hypothetical protein
MIQDSRSADAAAKILQGFKGCVMCDGYRAYATLAKETPGLVLAHCWSHVRRKFIEIETSYPEQARTILDWIRELYRIEDLCPTGPPGNELRRQVRESRSRPIIMQIQKWAVECPAIANSGLAKAIDYMAGIWTGLTRFLDDPTIPLDNNSAERAMRGPVLGRKNHYGSRSERGTQVAALFYSLLESAKLAGVDPKQYMRLAVQAALGGELIPLPHEIAATTFPRSSSDPQN